MRQRFIGLAALIALVMGANALAVPTILTAFEQKYPASTLSVRMANEAGSSCFICHHLATPGPNGANCYRGDLAANLPENFTFQDILDTMDLIEDLDSDGDGVSNVDEITWVRSDLPGEVGYNPGLIGLTGTDPCAPDPDEVVSGQRESPLLPVPTVSTWGMVVMLLLMLSVGTSVLRERQAERVVARS